MGPTDSHTCSPSSPQPTSGGGSLTNQQPSSSSPSIECVLCSLMGPWCKLAASLHSHRGSEAPPTPSITHYCSFMLVELAQGLVNAKHKTTPQPVTPQIHTPTNDLCFETVMSVGVLPARGHSWGFSGFFPVALYFIVHLALENDGLASVSLMTKEKYWLNCLAHLIRTTLYTSRLLAFVSGRSREGFVKTFSQVLSKVVVQGLGRCSVRKCLPASM